MAGSALRRLIAEYKQLTTNPPDGILAGPMSEENFFEWEALITGPSGTPFEFGVFVARLAFPTDYPLSPPKMRFTSELFHPNIYADGRVCISILHSPGEDPMGYETSAERWSPVQSIEKILLSVVSLLAEPNDASPANVDAAKMWREQRDKFNELAKRSIMMRSIFRQLCAKRSQNFNTYRFVQNVPATLKVELDSTVAGQLQSNNRKLAYFKQHKGKFHLKVSFPKKLEETINTIISDINPTQLKNDVKLLDDYLESRHLPIENKNLQELAKNIVKNMLEAEPPINILALSPEQRTELDTGRQTEMMKRLRKSVYHWEPLRLDEYRSKIYLAGNIAPHYGMLVQIFNEIKERAVNFRPMRMLDYGSGVGSAMWAALNVWGKNAFIELLNVDKSRDMNNLSQLIVQDGRPDKPMQVKGVIYRQFAPHGRENTFDLVVCDHTLFEFENRRERLNIVQSLWYNVKPGGFLVFVERGNMSGYSAINEAREHILYRLATFEEPKEEDSTSNNASLENSSATDNELEQKYHPSPAYIFSPCPHNWVCPKKKLHIPCRIESIYQPLQIFDIQKSTRPLKTVRSSYIVIHKAVQQADDMYAAWPRVIEPVIQRKHHQHVRLCCPNGEFVNIPVSKNKYGSGVHRLSQHSESGDLFPIKGDLIGETEEALNSNDEQEDVNSSEKETEKTYIPNMNRKGRRM